MSSPPLLKKSDQVDKILASSFYMLENSWPLPEEGSIFLAIEDYIECDFDPNLFQQENSSGYNGRFDEALPENRLEGHEDNICSIALEESILLIKENANYCDLNSFFEKENPSVMTEPIAGRGLLENSIKSDEDNGLSTILKAQESSCPILEEKSMSSSIKSHDNIDKFDQSTYLEQESSVLEPCHGEQVREHGFNNCNEDNLAICFEASVNSLQTLDQQETSALASSNIDKGLLGELELKDKTSGRKQKLKRLQIDKGKVVQLNGKDGTISKKQEHNAKEKVRRIKLNASYLALGALLPADSRRKKKRRTAPSIVGRALEYIPELENEIKKLNLRKNDLLSKIENQQNPGQNSLSELQAPTISVHEVVKGEVIVQIVFISKDQDSVFSKLLQNLEAEGMSIMNASTLQVCKERVCCNLHIQMDGSSLAANYVDVLKEEMISWLC